MARADESPEKLDALYAAKASAEVAAADRLAPGSDTVASSGALIAEVALVKGLAGPAEASGGRALSGADGEALAKALAALGHNPEAAFRTLSRPDSSVDADARAARLRGQLEAVDAPLVIALDAQAAEDVAAAFGIPVPPFGTAVVACGRRIVAIDGFEASLEDEGAKKRVWQQLRAATPPGPVF
ncbi:MAG TPA: hypothetical protein VFG89_08635 [Coriobacteriia bacterium]|nr:hypothetical protein [Coriobacteriia bacterium]